MILLRFEKTCWAAPKSKLERKRKKEEVTQHCKGRIKDLDDQDDTLARARRRFRMIMYVIYFVFIGFNFVLFLFFTAKDVQPK